MLSLWFYGGPFNSSTEQMYLKLNDVKVIYDGEPGYLQQSTWQEWKSDHVMRPIQFSDTASKSKTAKLKLKGIRGRVITIAA